jgi:hypothetical protein
LEPWSASFNATVPLAARVLRLVAALAADPWVLPRVPAAGATVPRWKENAVAIVKEDRLGARVTGRTLGDLALAPALAAQASDQALALRALVVRADEGRDLDLRGLVDLAWGGRVSARQDSDAGLARPPAVA